MLKDAHRRGGTPIGEMDTQMAAHALAEGLTLVTHNTRHFDQVPSLQIEDRLAEPPAPPGPDANGLESAGVLGSSQKSSRGKAKVGGSTKRGNEYLRTLPVQGAKSAVVTESARHTTAVTASPKG